jgi:glycosyltransferase involved in cell wall biosynthesis
VPETAWSAAHRIDCVVPTHGRPELLAECLVSIAAQTVRPSSVTVVSDDADPRSRDVVTTFAQAHPDLAVCFVPRDPGRPGASASRNAGAQQGHSPVLAFLDDDDLWEPRYLEVALATLVGGSVDAVVTSIRRLPASPGSGPEVPLSGLSPRDVFRRAPHVTGSSIVLRREVFAELAGFDDGLPVQNDRDFFLRFLLAGRTYGVVTEPLVVIRVHPGERLTSASMQRADGILLFIDKHGSQFRASDRRALRYISHRTRLSAATSRRAQLSSAVRTLATWSPTAGRQLPIGLFRMVSRRVGSATASMTRPH